MPMLGLIFQNPKGGSGPSARIHVERSVGFGSDDPKHKDFILISQDCASFEEINEAIDDRIEELEAIRREARRRFKVAKTA